MLGHWGHVPLMNSGFPNKIRRENKQWRIFMVSLNHLDFIKEKRVLVLVKFVYNCRRIIGWL